MTVSRHAGTIELLAGTSNIHVVVELIAGVSHRMANALATVR
jgi:hypothetical protein